MIAIQLVRFRYLPTFLLLIGCQSVSPASTGNWEARKFNVNSLQEMRSNDVKAEFIDRLKDDYRDHPLDSGYPQLKFSSAYESHDSKRFFYVFDILAVEDVQVVYELNNRGSIVDRYVKSPWR